MQPSYNASQKRAIEYDGGHLLIVAGPGTGKTHTLTARILAQIPKLKPHQEILAVTFTNKAALEMHDRLSARMDQVQEKVLVGTFHFFCLKLLRKFAQAAQFPEDFKIIGPQETDALVKELWPELKLKERTEKMNIISRFRSVNFDQPFDADSAAYQKALHAKGLMDFDGLLYETWKLLSSNLTIKAEVQISFPLVFVDEYQDINPIQHALLRELIGPGNQLTAIGDPNQAIYGFRLISCFMS